MLPHKLSNGICSLNAGENRLALSCIMKIDEKGNVTDHTIAETVIKVDRRMSYTSVKKILEEHDVAEIEEYKELVPMFERLMSTGFPCSSRIIFVSGKSKSIEPRFIRFFRNIVYAPRKRDSGTGLFLAGTAICIPDAR